MKIRILVLVLLVSLASILGFDASDLISEIDTNDSQVLSEESQYSYVTRIVDGDTIELETNEKVRYIGIDTPEINKKGGSDCYAEEAKMYNSKIVLGKKVRLEKDVSDKDRYGRLLRYVFVDDVMINEKLVLDGYALVATYPPDVRYQNKLLEAQQQARLDYSGFWGACPTL